MGTTLGRRVPGGFPEEVTCHLWVVNEKRPPWEQSEEKCFWSSLGLGVKTPCNKTGPLRNRMLKRTTSNVQDWKRLGAIPISIKPYMFKRPHSADTTLTGHISQDIPSLPPMPCPLPRTANTRGDWSPVLLDESSSRPSWAPLHHEPPLLINLVWKFMGELWNPMTWHSWVTFLLICSFSVNKSYSL